jgi:hypothetical protein
VEGSRAGRWHQSLPARTFRNSSLQRLGVRGLTAGLRQFPDFVIIGAQRAGTTSLTQWMYSHPQVEPARTREVHFFDLNYDRGLRWYRSNFPIRHEGQVTGESTPYMLFHPLAPERAARDLPDSTRFIVLLRDPVERAISQYWLNRRRNHETESFAAAIRLEPERLAGQEEVVRGGGRSDRYQRFSYASRGHYAEQLERWFGHVGRDRVLVVQSEEMFASRETADGVLTWLGLAPSERPFPRGNDAVRHEEADADVIAGLRAHFTPYNRDLEELLGRPFWRE